MQWALLLLTSRPELQDQLFYDIKNLSLEEILRHHLLRGIWKEALRLYPVAPFLTRYLPADSMIGDYFIPKGVIIKESSYSKEFLLINYLTVDMIKLQIFNLKKITLSIFY
jgi:cytochrome P450